ncbi:MAG: hypothetical protein GY944_01910 [bacterium]|nr:hypothetical protein [bacterium]
MRAPRSEDSTCRECAYHFALDPRESHGLSDVDYLALVRQASWAGRYHFTLNQLYLYYCTQRTPHNVLWPFAGLLGGAAGHYLMGAQGAAFGSAAAAGLVYHGTKSWRPPARAVLEDLHGQMKAAGHTIRQYIPKPLFEFRDEERYVEHLPRALEIDHVIVVDRNDLVDWLVLNDLPRRIKALVVSQSGYPNYVLPIAREMLQKRKSLGIFLLHDSSVSPEAMKRNLAESGVLPTAGHRLYNLGIEPQHVAFMKYLEPIQPMRSNYCIPLDSIPYSILERALWVSISRSVPLLTGFATTGFVDKGD